MKKVLLVLVSVAALAPGCAASGLRSTAQAAPVRLGYRACAYKHDMWPWVQDTANVLAKDRSISSGAVDNEFEKFANGSAEVVGKDGKPPVDASLFKALSAVWANVQLITALPHGNGVARNVAGQYVASHKDGVAAMSQAWRLIGGIKCGSPPSVAKKTTSKKNSAQPSPSQIYGSRACGFRGAAWSIVQQTGDEVDLAGGIDPATVQHDVNRMNDQFSQIQGKFGYPSGSETLFGDLNDAWSYEVAIAQDNQNYWNDVGDSLPTDFDQQEEDQDTQAAWSSVNAAWGDVKGICPH